MNIRKAVTGALIMIVAVVAIAFGCLAMDNPATFGFTTHSMLVGWEGGLAINCIWVGVLAMVGGECLFLTALPRRRDQHGSVSPTSPSKVDVPPGLRITCKRCGGEDFAVKAGHST